MAYYIKCEMTAFEIQTGDICTPALPSVRGPLLPVTVVGLLYIYKSLISLKFETGSYFLKSTKNPENLGK